MADETVWIRNVTILRTDELVLWCEIGGERHPIPRAQVRNLLWAVAGEVVELRLPRWFAEERRLLIG